MSIFKRQEPASRTKHAPAAMQAKLNQERVLAFLSANKGAGFTLGMLNTHFDCQTLAEKAEIHEAVRLLVEKGQVNLSIDRKRIYYKPRMGE